MPRYTTDARDSSGMSIMRRKVVLREVSIPNRSPNRTPPLPQVARPIDVICSLSLVVIRAQGSAKSGMRSAKTDAASNTDYDKGTCALSAKAQAGVQHREHPLRCDGSNYGYETKAVNKGDNRTKMWLRSPRPPDPSALFGSGLFPCLPAGQGVLLLSLHPFMTTFPSHKIFLYSRESIIACQAHLYFLL